MTGRRRRARLLAAALGVCAMALTACSGTGSGTGADGDGGTGTRTGRSAVFGTMTEQEIANLERIVSGAESAAADAERLPGAP